MSSSPCHHDPPRAPRPSQSSKYMYRQSVSPPHDICTATIFLKDTKAKNALLQFCCFGSRSLGNIFYIIFAMADGGTCSVPLVVIGVMSSLRCTSCGMRFRRGVSVRCCGRIVESCGEQMSDHRPTTIRHMIFGGGASRPSISIYFLS